MLKRLREFNKSILTRGTAWAFNERRTDPPEREHPEEIAMATDTRRQAADRLFDSILERQTSVFDAFRNSSERNHRFSRSVIEGYRQGSRDWTEVTRRWAANPTDVIGVYEAMSEAVGNAQQRALALGREFIDDVVESQREGRDVIRQSFGDVRQVVERAQENAPQFLRRGNGNRSNGGKAPIARANTRDKTGEN
jgi:hypothetical protein